MKLKAYAKLNLLLNVYEKSFNGYHSLETIMTPIDLHDVIEIDILHQSNDVILQTNSCQVPTDENNILQKCITVFRNHFDIKCGFRIYLEKNIPISAGLGGESADAAALMHFLNKHFKLNLSHSDIFYFGRLLGWDVPICYFQKSIYINDLISTYEFLEAKFQYYVLLVKPDFGILTTDAFKRIDEIKPQNKSALPLIDTLIESPDNNISGLLHNAFITSDERLLREYKKLKKISENMGFDGISMSGTGSCFFMISKKKSIVQQGYLFFKDKYPFVCITKILNQGI